MDWSQSCVFLILHTNQKEGNPQGPGVHMNRKHHQMTKTPKKVSRNSGGCWKFTSPACLWGSVGSQGVGWDKQTTQKPTGPPETHGAVAGRFLPHPWTSQSSDGWTCSSPSPGCQRPFRSALTEPLHAVAEAIEAAVSAQRSSPVCEPFPAPTGCRGVGWRWKQHASRLSVASLPLSFHLSPGTDTC